MKPSSIAEPRSLQQWLPDIVFGFENLASHKLRSLLTMLGMIFGVAAVVAMLSIGAGAQQKVMAFIEQLGVRNLIVEAKESHNWQELQKVRKKSPGLTLSDYQIIRKNVSDIKDGTPRKRFTPGKTSPQTATGYAHRLRRRAKLFGDQPSSRHGRPFFRRLGK